MKITNGALLMSLIAVGSLSWSASAATISGTDLSGLIYRYSPDAQYVAATGATPALAVLSTLDSGVNGDAPLVYVRAPNIGLPSLGTLSTLSASYDLYRLERRGWESTLLAHLSICARWWLCRGHQHGRADFGRFFTDPCDLC